MNLTKLFVSVLLQHLFRAENYNFSWIWLQQKVILPTKTCVIQVVLHQVLRKKMSVYTSNQTNITDCPITTDQDAQFLIGFRFWFGVVSCCVAITGNIQSFMIFLSFNNGSWNCFWKLLISSFLSLAVVLALYHRRLNADNNVQNIVHYINILSHTVAQEFSQMQ